MTRADAVIAVRRGLRIAFARALEEQGLTVFRVPVLEVVLFVLGSMIAGVLAAVLPAWRASRLDVLEAIATE